MSNRSLTPPGRSHIQTELVDEEHAQAEGEPQSTPTQRKRLLDPDDEPYILRAQRNVTDKTPKKRKTTSSLRSYVKLNVIREAATVHGAPTEDGGPQCLISGVSDKMTVLEFSHVMSVSSHSEEMNHLEWSWKREFYSLNVDTRKNLQTIRITLHRWFDMTKASKPVGWFWLPVDLNVLTNMHAFYVGDEVILLKAEKTANVRRDPHAFYGTSGKFQYQFIPLPGMKASWSVKRYAANTLGPFDPKSVKHSVYPFSDLPHFELHVPYHFVIVNTGKKLLQLYGTDEINFEIDFPFLPPSAKNMMRAVRNIYVAWMMAMPDPKWLTREDYDDEQNSAAGGAHLHGGAGSDGGPQDRSMPSSRKDRGGQAQDEAGYLGATRGQRRAAAESLTPWDSASCLEAFKLVDEGDEDDEDKSFVDDEDDEDKSFADDEDDEYEDEEFFGGLKQWASDVWTATHSDSASDSEVTRVGGVVPPVLCKGVDVATFETPPLLSVQ